MITTTDIFAAHKRVQQLLAVGEHHGYKLYGKWNFDIIVRVSPDGDVTWSPYTSVIEAEAGRPYEEHPATCWVIGLGHLWRSFDQPEV